MTDSNRMTDLTLKYVQGTLSEQEKAELDAIVNASETNRVRFRERVNEETMLLKLALREEAMAEKAEIRSNIIAELEKPLRTTVINLSAWRKQIFVAAASLLLVLAASLVLWKTRTVKEPNRIINQIAKDIAPGGNKAVLKLSNGTLIVLDAISNGVLAQQGSSQVTKLGNGKLTYSASDAIPLAEVYNTITTPAGGQYQVTLQDGTKVWLNAASSMRFPTAFADSVRRVEITGEAYFEVAHDPSKQFQVSANGTNIQVIGTHFNVNAYPDESSIKTTLLEGSVKVSFGPITGSGDRRHNSNDVYQKIKPGQQSVVIKPGEQAIIGINANNNDASANGGNSNKDEGSVKNNSSNKSIQVRHVDVEQAVAWKNGYFQFDGTDIQQVMRSMARWYNVKVRYEGDIPKMRLNGSIGRDNMASDVLKVLQVVGFHFRIERDTIIIMP